MILISGEKMQNSCMQKEGETCQLQHQHSGISDPRMLEKIFCM
jgi:hypothetical protein